MELYSGGQAKSARIRCVACSRTARCRIARASNCLENIADSTCNWTGGQRETGSYGRVDGPFLIGHREPVRIVPLTLTLVQQEGAIIPQCIGGTLLMRKIPNDCIAEAIAFNSIAGGVLQGGHQLIAFDRKKNIDRQLVLCVRKLYCVGL